MINLQLNLRPAAAGSQSAVAHPAVAWLIPGGDASVWLEEIERWDLPASALRLFVLPASGADVSPAGVLVVLPPDAVPRQTLRAQPYGRLARKLHLPVDAVLWPPVSDSELRDLLLLPTLVLHPSIGLVGFTEDDELRVHDLLASPQMREIDWGRAIVGQSITPRIRSVEPLHPPELELLLEGGRGDIGSQSPDRLPRGSDESMLKDLARKGLVKPAAKTAAAALSPLKLMAWLASKIGPPPQSRAQPPPGSTAGRGGMEGGSGVLGGAGSAARRQGWIQRVYDSLSRRLDSFSSSLLDQRQQALERLKKMLEEDPDEGLRHAISLRGAHSRGIAPPSAGLPTRDLQFNLSSAMGGGALAGDAWDVSDDTVQILTQRYRQAANRELLLGRYQRAAYVYAELLGDYAAAANALEQGQLFREAAVFYRKKLNNPQRAAICLEQGGLLVEAAAAFFELKQFERAGDLYARVDQREEAEQCYDLAVGEALSRQDRLAAAKVMEAKLESPDRALSLLDAGWPESPQAAACLKATFALLARLGRHDETRARVASLGKTIPRGRDQTVMQALADVAVEYSDLQVRVAAADTARVVAGRVLPKANLIEQRAIVQQVRRLAPEDRLLGRDVTRYIERPKTPPPPPADPRIRDVVVVRQFRLSGDANWVDLERFEAGFCAVGWTQDETATLTGVLWSGARATALWLQRPRHFGMDELKLHAIPGQRRMIAAVPFDRGSQAELSWSTSTVMYYSEPPLVVSRPTWLPDAATTIAVNERGVVWELADDEVQNLPDPVLTAYNASDGHLLSSHSLPNIGWPDASAWHPVMLAIQDVVYAAWGRGVLRFIPITETRIDAMPSVVTGLIASHGIRDRKVVAVMEEGCALLSSHGRDVPFATNMQRPVATFLRSGKIVVIDSGGGHLYDLPDGGDPRRRLKFPIAGDRTVKVIAGDQADQFVTLSASGQVTVYQAPT